MLEFTHRMTLLSLALILGPTESLVWTYRGGITSGQALLNLHSASSLMLSGGDHFIEVLAPHASVTFTEGLLIGRLVARDLLGAGQVNFPTGILESPFCFNGEEEEIAPAAPEIAPAAPEKVAAVRPKEPKSKPIALAAVVQE